MAHLLPKMCRGRRMRRRVDQLCLPYSAFSRITFIKPEQMSELRLRKQEDIARAQVQIYMGS